MTNVKLGQKVRDSITGYEGTAIAITEWLNGCVRIAIQAKQLKDGQPVEPYTVDVEQVEVVEEAPQVEPKRTGGSRSNITRAVDPSR